MSCNEKVNEESVDFGTLPGRGRIGSVSMKGLLKKLMIADPCLAAAESVQFDSRFDQASDDVEHLPGRNGLRSVS